MSLKDMSANETVNVDRPMRSRALARMAVTGIYLLRGVSRNVQRAARARAVSEGTTLRRVLLQGLHEYAAGTWTPQADAPVTEAPSTAPPLERGAPAAKFTQICASQNDLFALDAGGGIHQYNFTVKSWEKLLASRSLDSPERGSRGPRGGAGVTFP
jgi:hypothetical protein